MHLGPIADEVDPAIARLFPRALRAATPQGWLRRWDEEAIAAGEAASGTCSTVTSPTASPDLDVIVLSEEDVAGDPGAVDAYRARTRILVLTHGAQGATIYAGKGTLHVPAFPAREVDPTGAGDVFAAAFLIRYQQSIAAGQRPARRGALRRGRRPRSRWKASAAAPSRPWRKSRRGWPATSCQLSAFSRQL